jgi:hypothetical protein
VGQHPQEQVERATGLAEDDRAVVDSCRHLVAQEADAGTLEAGLERAAADLAEVMRCSIVMCWNLDGCRGHPSSVSLIVAAE